MHVKRSRTRLFEAVLVVAAGSTFCAISSPALAAPKSQSAPDTVIDSAPPALTNSTTATFAFHSSLSGASFSCRLDKSQAAPCTSPLTYSGLASDAHTVSVTATVNRVADPTPATVKWTVDTTAPTVPGTVSAKTSGATAVTVSWKSSTDAVGVTGYDVFRDGSLIGSTDTATTYVDDAVATGSVHRYAVRAKDGAGNVSVLSGYADVTSLSAYDPHLTRAPYLTDLVGLHVAINFATDQSGTTASVKYGAVDGSGGCTPSTTATPSRITITVGSIHEYQWTARLALSATGVYCYRVFLGGTDLLAGNASPRFTTQVAVGDTSGFTFDVLGDWGQVNTDGTNPDQANLMRQIAGSGARFLMTVGDNGYPNGSQINYGDLQQTGADTSAIFGPSMWTVPGSSIPIFTAAGNHGLSGTTHTDITTWTQDNAVSSSGGRYQNDVYCCVNGSSSANYGSEWYAFNAGNARFYVLDSAWGDTNGGNATPYANDAAAHFAPGTPEYTWLLNDLQTHPAQLKFAFFHYPLYSDNNTQPSDAYLDGPANLEGLLGSHGVQMVFNGHAHIYERNNPSASGMPVSYVTGGGGSTLEPMGTCHSYDAYAIGWSPSKLKGSVCGSAHTPTSAANVFHFLKVTVTGASVTVTPVDSLGNSFDAHTYAFQVPPDTYLDSTPPIGTNSTSATFSFHASDSPATFACKLDSGTATSCASPMSYSGLSDGSHTFTVTATVNGQADPTPATYTWTVDATAPAAPTNLTAVAASPFDVNLHWSAATDNTGVTGYRIYRDGELLREVGAVTSFSDTVLGSSTHVYAVSAIDIAGNESARSADASVTTPAPPVPVFQDGFESGDLSAWSSKAGLVVETATTHTGHYAAEGNTTNGNTYAKKTLPSTYPDGYARVAFDVVAQSAPVNLLRLRDQAGNSIGYLYVDTTGALGFHNDALGTNTLSSVVPDRGWHVLELHIGVDSSPGTATGTVQVWMDNSLVSALSNSAVDVGAAPIGAMQIGDVQSGRTYDVVLDDAAFGTSRLGPGADSAAPVVPTGLAANAANAFEIDLSWDLASDDTVGYHVYRDGTLLDTLGLVTQYTDGTVLAGTTHSYAIDAFDTAANTSAQTSTVNATTPVAAPPVFADGFESGGLSAWTTHAGLTVETSDVRTGGNAAEGNTTTGATYAKRTLTSTYDEAYTRVAYHIKSQPSQVNLLRLRTQAGISLGYLYIDTSGRLGLHLDGPNTNTLSTTPGTGWHVLELHLVVSTGTVDVWLDGQAVPQLRLRSVALGSTPVGAVQIGETTTGRTYDVVFDDAAFSSSRIGIS